MIHAVLSNFDFVAKFTLTNVNKDFINAVRGGGVTVLWKYFIKIRYFLTMASWNWSVGRWVVVLEYRSFEACKLFLHEIYLYFMSTFIFLQCNLVLFTESASFVVRLSNPSSKSSITALKMNMKCQLFTHARVSSEMNWQKQYLKYLKSQRAWAVTQTWPDPCHFANFAAPKKKEADIAPFFSRWEKASKN